MFLARRDVLALSLAMAHHTVQAASDPAVRDALARTQPRGVDGRLPRLASLDLESLQDFTLGFRRVHAQRIRTGALAELSRILQRKGMDEAAPLTFAEMCALVENEPGVKVLAKSWLANQRITWHTLHTHFHANADRYLSAMEACDRAGPGTLELAPTLAIPASARREFHLQPGGYVGDPFAGFMYHYGTNSFYVGVLGRNEQDQLHRGIAAAMPPPADGRIRRILDLGCGSGQLTVALKERFPDAEVWGLDVGGPMVRYAHARAVALESDVHFAQRLAERTGFPDGHFDLVVAYILHHEVPAELNLAIIDEARRLVRPGGVYYPLDIGNGGVRAPARMAFNRWWDHRWNEEPWMLEFHALDMNAELVRRGFTQTQTSPTVLRGFASRHFVRDPA
jgi:SAM-dependent methyltransferase